MTALLLTLLTLCPANPPEVKAVCAKVGPQSVTAVRSKEQTRAVVLIHGLGIALLQTQKIAGANLRSWQNSDSLLVKRLSQDSDVYAFAYSQTAAVEDIAKAAELPGYIRTLKKMGYKEIVLVGHSAGGLIARQLVEDFPNLGVTRVIQVCSPNGGSGLAVIPTVRPLQLAFLSSLTRRSRLKYLADRDEQKIPKKVEFACIVANCRLGRSDGVVSCRSQWSEDLQAQGIPAYGLRATHIESVRSKQGVDLIARLISEPQRRWTAEKVKEARKDLLGE